MNNAIRNIIRQAIDIHVHIGPEAIPRKYTVEQLVNAEKNKIGGFVLKNHFYATTPFIKEVDTKQLSLFGGIVMNNAVGGLNPEAIYAASLVADRPLMVWFPTINAKNFLDQSEFEIAPEWVAKNNFKARKAQMIKPVTVTERNKLTKETIAVLKMIRECNAVLATGHIAWQESVSLVKKAKKLGVNNIIITHPIYQRIQMPIPIQKELAKLGCFMEQSYSMYSIDKIAISNIAEQIKLVGTESIILSSDVGQTFSPPPSEALYKFANLLLPEGITVKELEQMFVINPKRLLNII